MKEARRVQKMVGAAAAVLGLLAVPSSGTCGAEGVSHVPVNYVGKSLSGLPLAIPGLIQAESYDVAPSDPKGVTLGYQGRLHKTQFRPDADSVGLARFGAGNVSTAGQAEAPEQVYLGWTETGEWLTYTVRVKETGTYVLGGHFAAGGKGSRLSVTFAPDLTTGPVEIPTTAGYQPGVEVYHVWEKLDNLKEITLPAGLYAMTVKIEADAGLNLDYLTFTKKP